MLLLLKRLLAHEGLTFPSYTYPKRLAKLKKALRARTLQPWKEPMPALRNPNMIRSADPQTPFSQSLSPETYRINLRQTAPNLASILKLEPSTLSPMLNPTPKHLPTGLAVEHHD